MKVSVKQNPDRDDKYFVRVNDVVSGIVRRKQFCYGHDERKAYQKAMEFEKMGSAHFWAWVDANRPNGNQNSNGTQTKDTSFDYYVKKWLEDYEILVRQGKRKESSYANYSRTYNKHIKPEFAARSVLQIDRFGVNDYLRKKQKSLNNRTVKALQTILSGAFKKAMWDKGIDGKPVLDHNPAINLEVDLSEGKASKQIDKSKVLTEKELEQLLDLTRTEFPVSCPVVSFFAFTGCRIGEVFGVHLGDLDLDSPEPTIHIQRQVQRRRISTPKNHEQRSINLPDRLVETLKNHILTLPSQESDQILFPNGTNDYFNEGHWRAKRFNLIRKKYSRDLTPHTLRHTYCSILLTKGIDVVEVARLMGDRIETILSVYTHFIPLRDTANKVNEAFK